jgi:hypothetical protein
MELDNIKRKFEAKKKAKPIIKKNVIISPDGKMQIIKKRMSIEEVIEDFSQPYEDNPEDPNFRREMEGW